jgi:hypothetical protein
MWPEAALLFVGYTGRLFREGKTAISRELAAICDRLGTSAESWWVRLAKLGQGRPCGWVFAATCERLHQFANPLGVRRLVNLGRCPRAPRSKRTGGPSAGISVLPDHALCGPGLGDTRGIQTVFARVYRHLGPSIATHATCSLS